MIAAEGFTNIGDIDFDEQGNLYVLKLAANSLLSGDVSGAITRVAADGSRTTLVDAACDFENLTGTLCFPTGLTVGPDGMLYVINAEIASTYNSPGAMVVRINPDAPTGITLRQLSAGGNRPFAAVLALLTFAVMAASLMVARRRDHK